MNYAIILPSICGAIGIVGAGRQSFIEIRRWHRTRKRKNAHGGMLTDHYHPNGNAKHES